MRKIAALLMGAVILSASARIVKMPTTSENALNHEFIESVQLTDTGTIFTIAMFHLPGYWCSLDTLTLRGAAS